MRQTYRGITQDKELPTIEMMEGPVGGKYRGNAWTYSYPRHIPTPEATTPLKYRGVSYQKAETHSEVIEASFVKEQTPRPSPLPFPVKEKSLIDEVSKRPIAHESSHIHKANICSLLERRLHSARVRGDHNLIHLLEREAAQLICG